MNLNEAAEIVRNKATCNGTVDGILKVGEAYKILYDTMLSELDPTPIKEDLLLVDGWKRNKYDWTKNEFILWCGPEWELMAACGTRYLPTTLGEIRTLLRLLGGE